MPDEPISNQWSELLKAVESEATGSAQKIHDLGVLIGKQLDQLEAGGEMGATRAKVVQAVAAK